MGKTEVKFSKLKVSSYLDDKSLFLLKFSLKYLNEFAETF